MEKQEKSGLVCQFKAKGGIVASVFMNEREIDGKKVEIPSVSFQKRYMDKDGKWQTTTSLDMDDLPKAMLVLMQAYEYLIEPREAE